MINVILGKSKTGKSTQVYNLIQEDLEDKKRVILFVPSQSRAKAELEYMRILNKSGVMFVNITTIGEFVKGELKNQNLHIDENVMTKLDRKVILTQVVRENPDIFNVFNKVKKYPGFLDTLDIYMDLFRKSELESKDYENVNIEDKRADMKFKEILGVYEKYMDKIKENYIDSVDEMELFLSNFNKSIYFKDDNIKVYFDGYNNFSNNEYKLIDKLLKEKIDVTFTLNTDIEKIEDIYESSSIFEVPNKTYKRICKLASKNDVALENIVKVENKFNTKEDIKFIANNLFAQESGNGGKIEVKNIDFMVHTNVLKEAESVAKEILKKVKEGYKYSDFAIYTTSIDDYYKVLSKAFYENNLTLYAQRSKKLTDSILTKYILVLLDMAADGMNLNYLFEILKLGLCDIELKNIYVLENYINEFNVNRHILSTNFTLNDREKRYNLDVLNSVKDEIVNMYSFTKDMNNLSAKEIVQVIYNHLKECNIYNNYLKLISRYSDNANDIDMNNYEAQVWNSICLVFDSIIRVYKDEKITSSDFANVFSLVVKDVNIKTIPPTKDQIELLDINSSKTEPKKIVFFVGVVEGAFPKQENEDIFFTDNELEILKDKEIEFKETTVSKLNMGFFNIYEALNNIKEKVYIYIPAAKLDGKATRKSSLITLMEQISDFKIMGEVTKESEETIDTATSKLELFTLLVKKINSFDSIKTDEERNNIVSIYDYFKQDEKYSKILEFKKDDSNLSRELLDILYSKEFNSNVTKLEQYKKCPFSYFVQYILKIYPNKEAKVNSLELGSFMHNVLEEFSNTLQNNSIAWKDILKEDYTEILPEYEKILEDVIEHSINANLGKQKESVRYSVLKRKLTKTMQKVIRTIAISYAQSDFEPYGYELEIGEKSACVPMEIKLNDNAIMKIVGIIDRVDILKHEDKIYARIIDYKSSKRDLTVDKIKEGISLQLITYLMSFIKSSKEEKIYPAAMLYFNLSDKLVSMSEYEFNDERIKKEIIKSLKMKGIYLKDVEILKRMDHNFKSDDAMSLLEVTSRGMNSSKKVLEEKDFNDLCTETEKILKEIGDGIASGIVKIAPNKKDNPCERCKYTTICRKNLKV